MILCPTNGDYCDKYVFDKDWILTCDCENLKKDIEVSVNECKGVVFEE